MTTRSHAAFTECTLRNAGRRSRQTQTLCVKASLDSDERPLQRAGRQLVDDFIRSDMVVGVGAGDGSLAALHHMAARLEAGTLKNIQVVCTAAAAAAEAAALGIRSSTLELSPQLDFAFTDADLVQEGTLFSIVGRRGVPGRGSVLREKAIARAAKTFALIVPGGAFVDNLSGEVAVEIEQLNWLEIAEEVDDTFLGQAEVWRRPTSGSAGPMGGDFPLVTENGHFVLDLIFDEPIANPREVAALLEDIPGVKAHGLFLDEAYAAAVAMPEEVKIRTSLFKQAFAPSE